MRADLTWLTKSKHQQNLLKSQACAMVDWFKSPLDSNVGPGHQTQAFHKLAESNLNVGPSTGGGQNSVDLNLARA